MPAQPTDHSSAAQAKRTRQPRHRREPRMRSRNAGRPRETGWVLAMAGIGAVLVAVA
ncbi:hypothetical protein [Lysobacter capsici]|uniref:hypothetical protein n=1 Tax=Lysobacter capsici TaxID=435897 RepID=UPI00287BA1FB|nr:hypothetical protein [Lysobacter capsici]WND80820.1 hypothetical protein RJ610_00140 [Lysobacter capsici]WND86016.1 hypothetical protein RJ609_00140 [Lysobacter capsici]